MNVKNSYSQNVVCIEITWISCKMYIPGPYSVLCSFNRQDVSQELPEKAQLLGHEF